MKAKIEHHRYFASRCGFSEIFFVLLRVHRYSEYMSLGEEPSWDSLPDHLKTSRLAHAVCPEGAAEAEHGLEKIIFWGRFGFFSLSCSQLGAFLWRKFGEQLKGMSDAEVLAWMTHMNFRDHAAFEEMNDQGVLHFVRAALLKLDDYSARYIRSHDYPAMCETSGITPGVTPQEQIEQARKFFRTNDVLVSILPELLEEKED